MKVSVILAYLVILCQFHCVLCDHPAVDRDSKRNERMKRYHENDCQKRNKTATPIGSKHIDIKAKTVPQTVNKAKLPRNERNQPKDVRTVNHILEEIASLTHNHNKTKDIHKIRHLVDELDNLHKIVNCTESGDVTPKKEISNEKETKAKETNKLTQERKTVFKMDAINKTTNPVRIESKDSININKSLLTNGRCYNEILTHVADETTRTKTKNENVIEIVEHKYEEELLRSPYNTYNSNTAQNFNSGPIINANNIENDSPNLYNYPLTPYDQYNGNNEYNYAKSNSPSNQPTYENNGDYARCRKTWLDRNSIISNRNPNEEIRRTISEDRKELTNVHYPDYYRKYYSVTQKQYSRNNEGQNNPYWYYLNPYQCRK